MTTTLTIRDLDDFPLEEKVDTNIYQLVKRLNDIGLTTEFSCAGYGPQINPFVGKEYNRKRHYYTNRHVTPQLLFDRSVYNTPIMDKLIEVTGKRNTEVANGIPLIDIEHLNNMRLVDGGRNLMSCRRLHLAISYRVYEYLVCCFDKGSGKRRYLNIVKKWHRIMNEVVDDLESMQIDA